MRTNHFQHRPSKTDYDTADNVDERNRDATRFIMHIMGDEARGVELSETKQRWLTRICDKCIQHAGRHARKVFGNY